jgi:3',5'-cyclic AMP phosphodiesterase CpdA
MLIVQISDLHVAAADASVRQFVDTNANLERAIAYIEAMRPRPDLVVATGDLTDNGLPEEYRLLRALLDRFEIPVRVIPGNHDDIEPLVDVLDHHTYLPRDGGPLQYAIEGDVRIVAVDTTRPGYHEGWYDADRLQWLDATLSAAPNAPTLVMMHHPPFDTGIWWMDRSHIRGVEEFERVIRRHPQVRRVIAGHIHRSIQITWGETMVSVAPSTAHQVALTLTPEAEPVLTAEPPMFALLDWNGDRCISYLSGFDADVPVLDIAAGFGDWSAAVRYLRRDPEMPKQAGH